MRIVFGEISRGRGRDCRVLNSLSGCNTASAKYGNFNGCHPALPVGGGGGTSCTPVGYREVPQVRQLGTYSEGVEQNNLVEQSVSTDSLGA